MSPDRSQPGTTRVPSESKDSEKGSHAKVGLPGKIQRARSTAPEWAGDDEINDVAFLAFEQGVDPADVWRQKQQDIGAFAGGPE